jgi:hypothetical protein
MVQAPPSLDAIHSVSRAFEPNVDMHFRLPDPEDELIPELEFQEQVEQAWQGMRSLRPTNQHLARAHLAGSARSRKAAWRWTRHRVS